MTRPEFEAILREHLAGVKHELGTLLRGVEVALDKHLAATEAALADALAKDAETNEARLSEIENRLSALESRR